MSLAVIETHPVQYHAPVYRMLQQRFGIPITAVYGSDFSVTGYHDEEFGATFAWDTDLLSGYRSVFLSQVANGGARSASHVSAQGLGAALTQINPIALLLTGYSPRFYQDAIWHASRSRYSLLFRAETADHARKRNPFKQFLRDRLLAWLYNQCAALLYIGQKSLSHYRRLGCREEVLFFSPYCVDTSVFKTTDEDRRRLREPTRQTLGILPEQLVILFSGKLVLRKQPDILLQAIKALPESIRKRIHLLFLGDGSLRNQLEQTAPTHPEVHMQIIGFQNQRLLSQYYHAADLLVLPSYTDETWGLVVNEALHHGLPCVVSDMVGCAPDLIVPNRTGEIFTAGSSQDLARALERAIMLLRASKTYKHCQQQVANYTIERAALGIAQAYWNIIA